MGVWGQGITVHSYKMVGSVHPPKRLWFALTVLLLLDKEKLQTVQALSLWLWSMQHSVERLWFAAAVCWTPCRTSAEQLRKLLSGKATLYQQWFETLICYLQLPWDGWSGVPIKPVRKLRVVGVVPMMNTGQVGYALVHDWERNSSLTFYLLNKLNMSNILRIISMVYPLTWTWTWTWDIAICEPGEVLPKPGYKWMRHAAPRLWCRPWQHDWRARSCLRHLKLESPWIRLSRCWN